MVEEELDETIKALEKQVINFNSSNKHQLEVTTSASLGNLSQQLYPSFTTYILFPVSQAAVSVKDAAGAVREVAQNILKVEFDNVHFHKEF